MNPSNKQPKTVKKIEIDDELYQYIAAQTEHIGESASSILRRLLKLDHSVQEMSKSSVKTVSSEKKELKKVPAVTPKEVSELTEILPIDGHPMISLVNSREFLNERKSVNRFLMLLSALYQCDHDRFSMATLSLHGSRRIYIAPDKKILMNSGSNTKPKLIPETPYWVVTNNNTERKSIIVTGLMEHMGFDNSIVKFIKHQFDR